MDCGIPFCHNGCPLGNLIPEWNDLVYRDDWRDAIERLHATNNFPEFTGRLCPAPCESACVLGINQPAVTIKNVEVSIIDRAWEEGWVRPQPPAQRTGKKVAVVGSGPAGLAAAQQLTRAGHTVTVYRAGRPDRRPAALRHPRVQDGEAAPRPAARPDARRRHRVPHRRQRRRGPHRRPAARRPRRRRPRRRRHRVPRDLPIPGRDLTGVHQAMEYLPLANRVQEGDFATPPITAEGKHVVVIGGGDTGADCVGTAHRQGARSRHPAGDHAAAADHAARAPAVADMPDALQGHQSRTRRAASVSTRVNTQEFVDDGQRRVRCASTTSRSSDGRVRTGRPARNGRSPPSSSCSPWASSARSGKASLEQLGVALDERGNVRARPDYATSVPGVFVRRRHGPRAVASSCGRSRRARAAAAVDAYLCGETALPTAIPPTARPLTL